MPGDTAAHLAVTCWGVHSRFSPADYARPGGLALDEQSAVWIGLCRVAFKLRKL